MPISESPALAPSVVDEVKYTYNDWGNTNKFEQDVNSAVGAAGSVDDMEISYSYSKDTTSWKNVRRRSMALPDGTSISFNYSTTEGADSIFDDDVSRVSSLKIGATEIARYWYNGLGSVVGTIHAEPDIMWEMYSSGSYPDLDRFNRVTSSRWTKDLATDFDFFDLDITYDRNSNINLVEDNIHVHGSGIDVEYTNDDLNRLTQAEQGVWGGSSITSTSHDQIWRLDQVGNWDLVQLDINGDGDFTDNDEYNDDRTHNDVNELTGRDTDDNGTDDYTLVYDAVGNLTDDNEHYKYEYDAFGRLRKITTQTDKLVAEYKYNGLNYRCSWHYDVDGDGGVEDTSDDPWFHFAYDERWRIVATVHEDDLDSSIEAKEQFVYHNAGLSGRGGSSYIDHVVLREKDANTSWGSASDATLEERIYFCHNWRGDISVLIDDAGEMVEWIRCSAYGMPYGIPASDTNGDGTVDGTDTTNVNNWLTSTDKPTGDYNLDGTVDSSDATAVSTTNSGNTLGWGALSLVGNRKGYAGYEGDPNLVDTTWILRDVLAVGDLGRTLSRTRSNNPYIGVPSAASPAAVQDDHGFRLDVAGCNSDVIDLLQQSLAGFMANSQCSCIPTVVCATCPPNFCAAYMPAPQVRQIAPGQAAQFPCGVIAICRNRPPECGSIVKILQEEAIHADQWCCLSQGWLDPDRAYDEWVNSGPSCLCREIDARQRMSNSNFDLCNRAHRHTLCSTYCLGPDDGNPLTPYPGGPCSHGWTNNGGTVDDCYNWCMGGGPFQCDPCGIYLPFGDYGPDPVSILDEWCFKVDP